MGGIIYLLIRLVSSERLEEDEETMVLVNSSTNTIVIKSNGYHLPHLCIRP